MLFINRLIWFLVLIFVLTLGIYFSVSLRLIQFRFRNMFKSVFFGSSFGILMTSLAGRIGVGSIAGVCLSIYVGGVGSIFWMWVSTFFCCVITYCEVVLGVKYKDGYGGPAYYIRDGLGNRFLGGLYSVLIIICYIGCFLCIQSNTITRSVTSLFSFSPYVVGLCISVVTFFCIYGGFKSIVGVCNKIVPIMCLIYIGSSILVLIFNYDSIISVFLNVFKSAFDFRSFFGGFIPMVIVGLQRGIFSNEAGIGTSSIVASAGSDFRVQGFVQMFGVYFTSFIICSATAIIVLFCDYSVFDLNGINGIELAGYAFRYHFGNIGSYILVLSVVLFSFSTIITGYYYGECGLNYFPFSNRWFVYVLRGITLVVLFFGCVLPSSLIWGFVDIFVGVLIIINLYSIFKLRNKVE